MVPEVGLEPTLCCQNGILNPARLPISPLRQGFARRRVYICTHVRASISVNFLSVFGDFNSPLTRQVVFTPDSIKIGLYQWVEMFVIHQERIMSHLRFQTGETGIHAIVRKGIGNFFLLIQGE